MCQDERYQISACEENPIQSSIKFFSYNVSRQHRRCEKSNARIIHDMEIRQKIITIHCAKEFQICRRRRRERGLKGSWKRDFLNLSKFFEKDYIFHFMEVILRRAGGGEVGE